MLYKQGRDTIDHNIFFFLVNNGAILPRQGNFLEMSPVKHGVDGCLHQGWIGCLGTETQGQYVGDIFTGIEKLVGGKFLRTVKIGFQDNGQRHHEQQRHQQLDLLKKAHCSLTWISRSIPFRFFCVFKEDRSTRRPSPCCF